jgi:hypothetical protein
MCVFTAIPSEEVFFHELDDYVAGGKCELEYINKGFEHP